MTEDKRSGSVENVSNDRAKGGNPSTSTSSQLHRGPNGPASLFGKAAPPYRFIVLPGNESALFRESLLKRGFWVDSEQPAPAPSAQAAKLKQYDKSSPYLQNFATKKGAAARFNLWVGTNGQKFAWDTMATDGSVRQMVNRVPHNVEICRKSNLAINLKREEEARGQPFDFLPFTMVMMAKASRSKDWQALKESCESWLSKGQRVWIVKPGAMNRGNGIEVFDSFEAIRGFIEDKPLGTPWVVQKYIEDPLLVEGRKFDIRAYALVTPGGQVLMYDDAYVRTSSAQYSLRDLKDRSLHLTNDAVQSKTDVYGSYEDSNKHLVATLAHVKTLNCLAPHAPIRRPLNRLTLEELQDRIGSKYDVPLTIVPRMREITAETFSSLGPLLNPSGLKYCYELYGLDFMIDKPGNVYLIEINTSPALLRHGKLLSDLIPMVVEEVVQKCIDPIFPSPDGPYVSDLPLDHFKPLVPNTCVGGRPRGSFRGRSVSPTRPVRAASSLKSVSIKFGVSVPPVAPSGKQDVSEAEVAVLTAAASAVKLAPASASAEAAALAEA